MQLIFQEEGVRLLNVLGDRIYRKSIEVIDFHSKDEPSRLLKQNKILHVEHTALEHVTTKYLMSKIDHLKVRRFCAVHNRRLIISFKGKAFKLLLLKISLWRTLLEHILLLGKNGLQPSSKC